jgi:hypothetical protein
LTVQILRDLPFLDVPSSVTLAGERVDVRAYQIIVWVSVSVGDAPDPDAQRFPAVLDTGHSHNFSIQEGQLLRWANLRREGLEEVKKILVNRQEVPLLKARVWVHRNKPGSTELLPRPVRLEVPDGVAVYPGGAPNPPRLPLVGMRLVARNKLKLAVDGGRMRVSLKG